MAPIRLIRSSLCFIFKMEFSQKYKIQYLLKIFLGNSSLTRFLYCNFSYNSIYPHIKFFFSRLSGFQLVNKYVSETTCGPVHFHIGLNIKLGRTTNQIKSKFSSETMCSWGDLTPRKSKEKKKENSFQEQWRVDYDHSTFPVGHLKLHIKDLFLHWSFSIAQRPLEVNAADQIQSWKNKKRNFLSCWAFFVSTGLLFVSPI